MCAFVPANLVLRSEENEDRTHSRRRNRKFTPDVAFFFTSRRGKSELPNCFEKKEKDSEDEKDENDIIPNILRTPRERRRENEAEILARERDTIRFSE